MENLCLNSKRAIEELERGREFLSQLRRVIQRSDGGGGGGEEDDGSKTTPFAQLDLAEKVERSFCNTLAMLNRRGGEESDDVVSQMLTDYSSCLVPAKSEDSEDTCKSTSAVKERRGCYKRRKTSQTWERNSEAPIDDGHAWRKYGQKTIMNAKFPRNYFRCTHKFDQGCLATKQVQMIQEEPVLYRTTYYGHHTCNRNLLNPEIILDSASPNSDSSILLSFDNNNNSLSSKQDLPFFSSSSPSPSPSKEYCKQEIPSSSSEDYLLTNELINTLSSTLESNHKDVIPDVLYDSVDFNGFFEPFDV